MQRLAVVAEDTPESAFLAAQARGPLGAGARSSSAGRPCASGRDRPRAAQARAALASSPDVVYWAGSAEGAGRLVALLRRAGFKGVFLASAQSESPAFVAASGAKAVEGAFVVAPARAAAACRARAAGRSGSRRRSATRRATTRCQAYDAVRALAQAVTQTGEVDHALNTEQLPRLDLEFTTLLGVVQFARDHTIQEDDHIILVVRKGRFRTETALRSNSG